MARMFVLLVGLGLLTPAVGQGQSVEKQIADAIAALPPTMRDGATVIAYDGDAEGTILRRGTNDMICWADEPTPGFYVACFHKVKEPYEVRRREFRVVQAAPNWRELIDDAIDAGEVSMPDVAIRYELQGNFREVALPLSVVHIPYATPESTGLSTEPDNYRPWLMLPGTPRAHIMLPGQ